ncbi:hypothetical protein R1sor_024503 [Riccia sorocarpa]|uniref:Uncharacterized protein n=1 Tax=Riccia sorocarpa TaxID=122646 RepID=A0ABD3GTQ4_9MARC
MDPLPMDPLPDVAGAKTDGVGAETVTGKSRGKRQVTYMAHQGSGGRRRLRETSSSSTTGTSQTGSYDSDHSGDESAAPPLPQRPRLEDARLPVTCHCAKCKGLTTNTAIEAERHIQQWGRHDKGESFRAASGRRQEVQSRSRPAVRDILRHSFIQFSLSAIQDFATQLRTNRACTPMPQPVDPEMFRRALETMDISALFTPRTSIPASLAVPPPDLARHAQPEPEVDAEVDPTVDLVVEPEVEHIMEPTASMESQHPSTEIHGVVGESIVVVERYVAPYRDDDTSGCSRISPPPMTPPRTRRGRRGSQSLAAVDSLVLDIPSPVVRRGIRLRGEAARIYMEFDPASLEVPPSIPIGEEVSVWGRRWIVRQSTLGRFAGHGLFACEDILFDSAAPEETRPSLFPYVGSVYSHDEWLVLIGAHPTGFRTYLLDVDSWRGSSMPREEYRFVDGDPARCPNLAGYINNVIGTRRPQRQTNVM